MKVVQFFKIYNFHVMQILTRSKDLKIFSKIQINFIPLRKNTFNCKNYYIFGLKCNNATKIIIISIIVGKPFTKLKILPKSNFCKEGLAIFYNYQNTPYFVLNIFRYHTKINTKFTHSTLIQKLDT